MMLLSERLGAPVRKSIRFNSSIILATVLFLTSCASPQVTQEPISPQSETTQPETSNDTVQEFRGNTILFYNGQIITMNDAQPLAEAVLIEGDTIRAVGNEPDVMAQAGPGTVKIDLQGKTLMPGFVDAHTHLLNDASHFGTDLDGIQQLALENGITTIGNMYSPPDFLETMRNYEAENKLRIRTSLYLNHNTNCGDIVGDWWKDISPTRVPGEMLRIGGVKVFADGGSCKRPALSYETSPGSGYGDLFLTSDQIAAVVSEAQSAGHQVAIHALGDRAIEAALDGIESALGGGPNTYRHRIEHNAILRPDLLPRYGELDIVATIFGTFPSCISFENPSPPPYNEWEWAWDTLVDANPGLHIAWHGDDPYIKPVSPVLELYGMVTRNYADDDRTTVCEGKDWIIDNKLSVEQALPMMTRESAYALFRDDEVGTIEIGKYADLIILSENPLAIDPELLRNTYVLMTMVGGNVEWCAPGSETLCPAASTPFGYLDNPSEGQTIFGTINVFGWALDDSGPIDRVEIYLDGEYIGNAVYGDPRPDVANDYPGRDNEPDFGYSFQLDTTHYENGPHTLYAIAFGVSGNQGNLFPETLSVTISN